MCEVILILSKQLMRSKRQRRLSQVMDEFSIPHPEDELEDVVEPPPHVLIQQVEQQQQQQQQPEQQQQQGGNRTCSPKFLWRLVKAPVAVLGSLFGLGDHYLSDYFDSMGTGDALRDARMRVWLRQDPTLADRHYLMVQSGMRYSFFLY